jgi:hypothetical protein
MEDALARGNGNRSHEGTCHTLPGKASYMFYGNALGVSLTAIYGLLDESEPFLVSKRPLRWKILTSLQSLQNYASATADPAFWADARGRQSLVSACREVICTLSAKPVHLA